MAMNRYEYGTSPRKIDTNTKPMKKKKKKKSQLRVVKELPRQQVAVSKEQKKKQKKIAIVVVAIFALLLTISYRNSQINEKFNEAQKLKKELASLQKENEQLKVSIENSVNFNTIEKLAKEKLGMQKLTNKQTMYVNLDKKDYIEVANSEEKTQKQKNWFEQIIASIWN